MLRRSVAERTVTRTERVRTGAGSVITPSSGTVAATTSDPATIRTRVAAVVGAPVIGSTVTLRTVTGFATEISSVGW